MAKGLPSVIDTNLQSEISHATTLPRSKEGKGDPTDPSYRPRRTVAFAAQLEHLTGSVESGRNGVPYRLLIVQQYQLGTTYLEHAYQRKALDSIIGRPYLVPIG